MSTEFGFIGHCYDPKENHDKVWGYFYRPGLTLMQWPMSGPPSRNCCIFWGRRGKAMQFKPDVAGYELNKLVRTKMDRSGYSAITSTKLYEIWPSFEMEKDLKLTVEILAGRVK